MSKRRFSSGLAVGFVIAIASSAAAQQQPLPATTVQLPTFSFFTVQTTVSVPDRGGAFLGGINRGRDGRVARGFGPLQNVGIGGDRLASGASVHARIIDTDEIDRMLLAAAAKRSGTAVDPALAKASEISKHIGARVAVGSAVDHSTAGAPLPGSVAAIRAENAAAAEQRSSEATELFAKAAAAEVEGKPAVAKIYYQMVVRRDTGELKQRAQARLAALAKPQALASQ